jgi:serine protease Do
MNQSERKNPIKIIAGIVWIAVFLSILLLADRYFSKNNEEIDDYASGVWQNVAKFFKGEDTYTGPDSLFKRQVVQEENSVISVVEDVSPAVVSIVVKSFDFDYFTGPIESEAGIGTGFIVDKKGLIVTNSHVVDNPDGEYSVVLKDGTTYEVKKINLDQPSDLAILEIDANDLPIVELGDSDSLNVGQTAIAIGNALGRFQNTVTVGVVSGIARELQASSGYSSVKTYEGVIQTDAALNPGNSGGPLLNSAGQVIGINVATSFGADNISFAVPVNELKPILEMFLKEGKIIRPYLGVVYTQISKDIARLRDIPEGAYISRVVQDSPAEKAGIQSGDILIKFAGVDIVTGSSLSKVISKQKVGDKVDIVVVREGKDLNLSATLEEVPEDL